MGSPAPHPRSKEIDNEAEAAQFIDSARKMLGAI